MEHPPQSAKSEKRGRYWPANLLALAAHGLFAAAGSRSHATIDHILQLIDVRRTRQRHVQSDFLFHVGVGQTLVEGLHARGAGTSLHRGINLVNLVLADQVTDGRRGHQHFHDHGTAAAVGAREQGLTKNALNDHAELGADLRLLVGRENVNDTVDGGSRRIGVQSGEGQVAGFRNAQGGFDGFQVAHFADEHHVGVFAQGGAQGVRERVGVSVHFALVHQALFVIVEKLDGVLNGDHVLFTFAVDLVQHGSEGGGFARAGWTGHQHKAARLVAQSTHNVGQAQRVETLDFPGNGAKNSAHRAALIETVATEAREVFQAEGKVQFEVFLEAMLLCVGEYAVG